MLLELTGVALARRLFPFSARVGSGELIHLAGPNGAGKSTLLACLAGLTEPDGSVVFAGQPLGSWSGPSLSLRRAYLPQQAVPGLMPVWHYLQMHDRLSQPRHVQLTAIIDALQLGDKLQRSLGQLSGGEWQRVRLAAVLYQIDQPEGRLLLLDEPLTGLDITQQVAFDQLLPPLLAAGITVVMSSHDINHTLRHADSVWLLRPGQSALQGDPQRVLTADTLSALYQVPFRNISVDGRPFLTTFS